MHATFLSTYPPRACGLATFTQDLRTGFEQVSGQSSDVVAMVRERGPQRPEVAYQVVQEDRADYARAADWLNATGTDVVSVQHEFGIFGGPEGAYVLDLLRALRRPVVTTLHTVLPAPAEPYLRAARAVVERSDRIVVTTDIARTLLTSVYGADYGRIAVIPHGSPDLDPTPDPELKRAIGAEGRTVLFTFGLLGPGKGIEHAIQSLPRAVEARPDVLYIVLGATHPNIVEREGEAYREKLEREVREMGLHEHVRFENAYSDLDTVWTYLRAADVFVSPYPNLDQICSGTLAYALGAGKAVVSTPYLHARDVLGAGRGILAPHDDPDAFGEALARVCEDRELRADLAARALEYGRHTVWPRVAQSYAEVFAEAADEAGPVRFAVPSTIDPHPAELPAAIGYISDLTDDVSIVQHAAFGIPTREHGYSADDAARALAVVLRAGRRVPSQVVTRLTRTYLGFLQHSQLPDGAFHNFMWYDRRFADQRGSEDTLGRAMWGLGVAAGLAPFAPARIHARQLFERAMKVPLAHPRAIAYSMLGLDAYLAAYPGADEPRDRLAGLAADILDRFGAHARDGWHWPADDMTYANAIIPHAMLRAGQALDSDSTRDAGLSMLSFLSRVSFADGHFDAIGNAGWWNRHDPEPARFDQQPVEAGYMADACAYAWSVTGDAAWADRARAAAAWFYGDNRLGACLFDVETGACFDGLTSRGVNMNQGAESAIACALAFLAVAELDSAGARARGHHAEAGGDGASLRPAVSHARDDRRTTDGEDVAAKP